jgi:hypothetical protein
MLPCMPSRGDHVSFSTSFTFGTRLPGTIASVRSTVEALDPMAALGIVDAPGVRAVAEEAKARLTRAIATLEAGA